MAHLSGYARVSTTEQNPDLQVDELTAAGCGKVWTDHASGALDRRAAVLHQARQENGDVPDDEQVSLGQLQDRRNCTRRKAS